MIRIYFTILALMILVRPGFGADKPAVDTVKSAPGITIETAVDKSEINIGDLINYRLTIFHDSSIVLTPPPIGANLGAFDVKDYQTDVATKLEDGRIKTESRFLLTTFTTGNYIIPPIPIEFQLPDSTVKYLISEPTPIKVKSLLADSSDTADIRDIKGPIAFKSGGLWRYYLAAGVIIISAIVAFIYWRIRKKRKGQGEPVDPRKPWEIAFEDLAMLKEKDYPTKGEFKQFYIELTEIIRDYMQRIYRMPVLDMTTEEFLGRIFEEDISDELYRRLKGFLYFADLVKFAKLVPEPERTGADFDEAVGIIEYIRQMEMTKAAMPETAAAPETGGGNV
jgi:hypothetical protein